MYSLKTKESQPKRYSQTINMGRGLTVVFIYYKIGLSKIKQNISIKTR